jgi:hypothetical protein
MNCESRNRFDHYLGQAVALGCSGVADYYDSIDTTDVRVSRRLDRMVYRLIRKGERAKVRPQSWSTPRRVISCIVIALAILMALTMSIAALNGNLWNAAVDWYEDHFALHLGQTSSPPATLPPAQMPVTREPRKPGNLPAGWTEKVVEFNPYWVEVDLFRGKGEIGYYMQQTKQLGAMNDAPSNVIEHHRVKVNGYSADVYFCKNGHRILHWSDPYYYYSLTVYYRSLTIDQLIAVAESLEAIDSPPHTILEVRKPTGMTRKVTEITEQFHSSKIHIEYRDKENDRQLAFFLQHTLGHGYYDSYPDEYDVRMVSIGQVVGIAYFDFDEGIKYLHWSDGDYGYYLYNIGLTDSELIEWAESVMYPAIPQQLQTVYKPQNLPEDLKEVVWIKNTTRMEADYSRGDQLVFTYTQELLSQSHTTDRREYQGRVVEIHHDYGYAQLFTDGSITLTWNNGQYRFVLESKVMTLEELLAVAWDIAPPEEIVEVRGPSALSSEIDRVVVAQNESAVITEYSHTNILLGRFMQTLRWNDSAEYDPGCEMSDVTIGLYPGVLLTYPDGRRTVIWNDGSYRYQLESGCMTTEVILAWAESVKTVVSEEKPVDTAPPTTLEEERKPQKLASGMSEMMTVKTGDSVTVYYQKKGQEVATFAQRLITDDVYLDGFTYRSLNFNQYGMAVMSGDEGEQLLLWTDGQYFYELESATLSMEDMLICAQSMMERGRE